MPVGVAFVVTAFCFGIMAFQQASPGASSLDGRVGLMPFMDRHGMLLIGIEVALIAIFSCGAIATDEYWQRRDAKDKSDAGGADLPPGTEETPAADSDADTTNAPKDQPSETAET